ncbi:MAG: PIN domain-containing protein [Gaiellaceae bacterium]
MSYLLDTNVLSEPRKRSPDPRVLAWFATTDTSELFVSVLSLGEIRNGVERLRRRGDGRQAEIVEQWLEHLKSDFADRFVTITLRVAERWGAMNAERIRPTVDGLLAATALENDLTFVTRDTRSIESTGVRVVNPWT